MTGIKSIGISEDNETGHITITIDSQRNHVLIWMKSGERNNNDCNYNHFRPGREGFSFHTTFETERNKPYIICAARIVSQNEITVPPLNCRAYSTKLSPEDRPLILIKDKNITLVFSCFAVLVIVIVSGVISYKVVLNNPTLVKGIRVIVVKPEPVGIEDTPPSQPSSSIVSTDASIAGSLGSTNVEHTHWMYNKIDIPSGFRTESAIVFFQQQEQSRNPLHRTSDVSHTSCNTQTNSKTSSMTTNEARTVRFKPTHDDMTDNHMAEGTNESHI
jgi:hypothetical protein